MLVDFQDNFENGRVNIIVFHFSMFLFGEENLEMALHFTHFQKRKEKKLRNVFRDCVDFSQL